MSQPFPCQNRPCGCRSAEQCWKKCCCFTNSQKVAWAKANRVDLPDYVLAAAKKESAVVKKSCALCSKAKNNGDKPKCEELAASKNSKSEDSAAQLPKTLARTKTSKWVLSVYAAECQGQPSITLCFPATIIPARVVLVTSSVEMTEIVHEVSERLYSTTLRPPLPPPKIASQPVELISRNALASGFRL
ncbi:MAG: hypothetical protein U0936_06175 [Planctomycetaceae bacterium]